MHTIHVGMREESHEKLGWNVVNGLKPSQQQKPMIPATDFCILIILKFLLQMAFRTEISSTSLHLGSGMMDGSENMSMKSNICVPSQVGS
jgi:hypothetical protein